VLVNGKVGRDGEKNDAPLANSKIARGRPPKTFIACGLRHPRPRLNSFRLPFSTETPTPEAPDS